MGGLNYKKIKKWQFHRLKTWQILLILVPLLILDATLLRIDHLRMVEMRDAVLAADEEGDEAVLSQKLEELKGFTFSHIVVYITESNGTQSLGFGTGVFYLEQQYLRAASIALAEAEAQIADSDTNPNGNIFLEASEICKGRASIYGWTWSSPGYIDCMTSEIASHPAADNIQDTIYANIPSTELYRKSYASPVWAPCGSGFAILATLIILLILLFRAIFWVFLKIALRVMR